MQLIQLPFDHSVNKIIYRKKSLVLDCNTLAYRKGKQISEASSL